MSGDLEHRYRRLLWAYPPDWRADRGDELVGVLLDGAAAEGRTRPRLAEALDLAGNGLATRLRAGRSPALRTAWTEAAAVAACLMAAVLATRGMGELLDAYRWFVAYPRQFPDSTTWYTWENYLRVNVFGFVAWIALVPALLVGRAHWVSRAAVGAITVHLVGLAWSVRLEPAPGGNTLIPWLLFEMATVAVLVQPARADAGLRVVGGPTLVALAAVSVAARQLGFPSVQSLWHAVPVAALSGVLLWRRHWLVDTAAGRRFLVLGLTAASVYVSSSGLYRLGLPPRTGSAASLLLVPAAILLTAGAAFRLWPAVRLRLVRRLANAPGDVSDPEA